MNQIFVTGAGVVSAIGIGKEETLRSLREERTGVGEMKYLASKHRDIPVGEVKKSNEEMMEMLGIKYEPRLTRNALIGRLALREALREAALSEADIRKTHFISATTVGGMDKREQVHSHELDGDPVTSVIATHNNADCTEMIAEQFGSFASLSTVSTACSSATNAIITGANMLRCGLAERVVVGGAECLSMFHLNGFNTLMILDSEQCKPFDKNRKGLNLGEGAAYLVLETAESMEKRGVKPLCRISGYGNACDAFHQTASSEDGEGAYLAMKEALKMAGMTPADIQYINAHGTGTPNNDMSETMALRRVFGENMPPVSSTKSFTGHTTSASGSIEAVFCILALQHQFLPINLNWKEQMEDGIVPVMNQKPMAEIRNIQSNAFGFGGNDSSIIFSSLYLNTSHLTLHTSHCSLHIAHCSLNTSSIYIQAAEQISIQNPLSEQWMTEPIIYNEPYVRAINPNFRDYIAAGAVRRMCNVMRRALVTALKVQEDTGMNSLPSTGGQGWVGPDAIITGTCHSCMEYTEKFLDDMTENGEEAMSPTHFMQSTHNTVSSALAIHTGNHGYNTTYSHGACSFDLALLDGWMQMTLGRISTALVGGYDEMTEYVFRLLSQIDYVGVGGMAPCSEVSASMMLTTDSKADNLCELAGVRLLYNPSTAEIQDTVNELLSQSGLTSQDISVIMTGKNNSNKNDSYYNDIIDLLFSDIPLARYKNIFGENYSASALSVYAAAHCIKAGYIPETLYDDYHTQRCDSLKNVLLLNHNYGGEWSVILLKKI